MTSANLSKQEPRIAIVGGGLGGFAAALHLHRLGFSKTTVYERDTSLDARGHLGSCLDMHEGTGKRCLDEAGLDWRKHILAGEDGMRVFNKAGQRLYHDQGPPPGEAEERPEVDRTVLRQLLHSGVPPSSIEWSKAFVSCSPSSDGDFTVAFADGSTATADLVVGADGANSRLRPLVSQHKATFAGVSGAEVSLSPKQIAEDPELKAIADTLKPGMSFILDEGRGVATQNSGSGRLRAYAWLLKDREEDWVLPRDVEGARQALVDAYSGFPAWLHTFFRRCDPEAIYARPLLTLPPGHSWEHKKGVTLLGDAAHLLPPNGEGANLAMLDGLELAECLAAARVKEDGTEGEWWDHAVKEWEEKMLTRAKEISEEPDIILMMLGEDGAEKTAELFRGGPRTRDE